MNEKQQVIFNLDLLRRYLENFDPEFFCNAINHEAFVEDLKKAVGMLEEQEAVVRCKDCVIRDKRTKVCPTLQFSTPDTFFCGFGDRKDGETDG